MVNTTYHSHLTGSIVAIVTPFKDGLIDEDPLRKLVDWQIRSGTDGIVTCGTTGEAATLSFEERSKVTKICIEESAGRVPIIAGAGSNSTSLAVELSREAKRIKADAILQVTPYYNKPTQEGLYQHFKTIAQMVDLPILLYNVPGRTAVNMLPATVERLSKIENIIGIKEASGNLEQIKQIKQLAGDDFIILSGEDAQNLEIYKLGGKGAISVSANIIPENVAKIWDLFKVNKIDDAQSLEDKIQPLNKAMFIETNPIPVKTALAIMGKISEEFRLPMTPMGSENRKKLQAVISRL